MFIPESFEFKIKEKIKYGSDDNQISDTLYLIEPLGRHQRHYEVIDNLLCKALIDFSVALSKGEKDNARSKQSDQKLDHETLLQQIRMSAANLGDNTERFYNEFRELFVSGVCFFDTDKKHSMKKGWLEKLHPVDWTTLVREYAARFIAPKLM